MIEPYVLKKKVQPVKEYLYCNRCNSQMFFNQRDETPYTHYCSNEGCENTYKSLIIYPRVIFEEIPDTED